MSIVARKFSACPVRTAAQTWDTITSVLSDGNSAVEKELLSISGITASIISDGTPKINPITIIGSGPRLRVYCLYDEDGSTEDSNEASLNWNLFDGDWEIHLPVEKEDFGWVSKALKEKGSRFKAYKAGEKINEENSQATNAAPLSINIEKLKSYG